MELTKNDSRMGILLLIVVAALWVGTVGATAFTASHKPHWTCEVTNGSR